MLFLCKRFHSICSLKIDGHCGSFWQDFDKFIYKMEIQFIPFSLINKKNNAKVGSKIYAGTEKDTREKELYNSLVKYFDEEVNCIYLLFCLPFQLFIRWMCQSVHQSHYVCHLNKLGLSFAKLRPVWASYHGNSPVDFVHLVSEHIEHILVRYTYLQNLRPVVLQIITILSGVGCR